MNHSDDGPGFYRAVTCGSDTAPAMTRTLLRWQFMRPSALVVLLLGPLIAVVLVGDDGPPLRTVLAGLALTTGYTAILMITKYRRVLRAMQTLFPVGQSVSVELSDESMTFRNGVGEQDLPYYQLSEPVLVDDHVLIGLRARRSARITLPAGLLTADDVDWLRDRIDSAEPSDSLPATDAPATAQPLADEL